MVFGAGVPVAPPALADPPAYQFGPSGLDGAGFQNVIAMASTPDSAGQRPLVVGGDVSGYHRSIDGGLHWQAANLGVVNQNAKHIASLAFAEDPAHPDKVYGLFGNGTTGGLTVSLDGGRSWTTRSTGVNGDGGNPPKRARLPQPHPRSTGNLIVQDDQPEGTDALWVATFQHGVKRSTDDGVTWPAVALAGHYLRSLVKDPSDPDTIYAASWGRGVWVTHDARSAMTFTQLPNSPPNPEELVVIDQRLYAAAGSDGIWSYDPLTRAWSKLGAGQIPTASVWQSIAGYRDPDTGAVTLYAGCSKPQRNAAGRYQSVFESTDGGAGWAPITTRGVSSTVEGTDEAWWHASANKQAMLDGSTFVASQLLIDPQDHSSIYVSGRAGVWHSRDGGGTWAPAVRDLGATINLDVIADPNLPGRVYVTDLDWPLLVSSDDLEHVALNTPKDATATGASAGGLALDTSTTPSTVYVGTDGGRFKGEIWSNPDPGLNATWQRQGLSPATGGKHVAGVAVGLQAGTRVILAAVSGGVWRKQGTGTWTKVSPAGLSVGSSRAAFSWVPGSALVYLFDRSTGIWRSSDHGRSWIRLWDQASPTDRTGYVAADPTNPSLLFASVSNATVSGLYRFDDAGGATSPPVAVPGFPKAGAIVVDNGGVLFVHQPPLSGSEPAELSCSSDGGTTFSLISDDFYRAANQIVNQLAVDVSGRVFVALHGSGVTSGTPQTVPVEC